MNRTELLAAGMNVDEFLQRIMNNTALVKMFVGKFLEDTNFCELTEAIQKGDMRRAESCCHTLKGVCGNMALTELFNLFVEQLGYFRSADYNSAIALMPRITELYNKATSNMLVWLADE